MKLSHNLFAELSLSMCVCHCFLLGPHVMLFTVLQNECLNVQIKLDLSMNCASCGKLLPTPAPPNNPTLAL